MQSDSITIIRVGPGDIVRVAPLFDMYRQFYEQTGDPDGAQSFLGERMDNDESVIFLALNCDGGGMNPRDLCNFILIFPQFE